jgi:hypothetical protein
MKKFLPVLLSIFILLSVLGGAFATSFFGTSVGFWENVDSQPRDVISVHNGDEGGAAIFRWGLPTTTDFDNLFIFDGLGSDYGDGWTAETGIPFLLGSFSYRNERTGFSSTVNGVDLGIALNIESPTELDVGTFFLDFSFSIRNTPNTTGDPLLDADSVAVANTSMPSNFNFLGTDYILELIGFSSDSETNIITGFSVPEGSIKRLSVYGQITETAPVPEPATLILLGTGLIGLAGFGRRKFKKNKT